MVTFLSCYDSKVFQICYHHSYSLSPTLKLGNPSFSLNSRIALFFASTEIFFRYFFFYFPPSYFSSLLQPYCIFVICICKSGNFYRSVAQECFSASYFTSLTIIKSLFQVSCLFQCNFIPYS